MDALEELRGLIARHASRRYGDVLGNIRLKVCARPTEALGGLAEPALAITAQGCKRTVLGDRVFDYRAGQFLVVPVELPVTGHVTQATPHKPFLGFGLVLDPAAIASLLLDAAGDPGPRAGDPPTMHVSAADRDLLEAIVRLLRLLDRPADLPVLRAACERELLWRLVTGPQGAMVRQIGLADSRLSQIGRAIRWIRAHYAEPLAIDPLARLAGMSASSLHRHFRAVTTLSPLQYQKQIRLQEARARLMTEAGDVAAVGFAVGYDSPSQFSREYRRRFGTPPGKDAARLKTSLAAATMV